MALPNALRRLTPRIVVLMTLALLPLGLISIAQTKAVVREAEETIRAGLLVETVAYAGGEREVLQRGLGAINGLASAPLALNDVKCAKVMREFVERNREFVFVGFVPVDGMALCTSAPGPVDMSVIDDFETIINEPEPKVYFVPLALASRQSVISITRPVTDDTGTLIGQMSISIPNQLVRTRLRNAMSGTDDIEIASITPDGDIIASSIEMEKTSSFLPRDVDFAEIAALEGAAFKAVSQDGQERLYAVAELVDDTLYLVGSSAVDTGHIFTLQSAWWNAVLFPILMWIAGMSVAVIGLQRLVLRHVRELRNAMRRFALGERSAPELKLDGPPLELEEAQRAFNRMTALVSEAEARTEDDLRDKEVLLREVHHRVKNNLQLIASIMNFQSRRARSGEAKTMLAGLQRRVRGLAMLHRTLYTTPDLTTIDAKELIETVISDVSNLSTKPGAIASDLESFALYPDQAVPLSMLVAEAMTNAMKYADPKRLNKEPVRVILELFPENVARLRVTNPVDETNTEAHGDGLGSQLMTAFVRQLDGSLNHGSEDGIYTVDLTFERRDFEVPPYE